MLPEPIVKLITTAGFGHVLQIPDIPINHQLITALVDRWRPETHTFHFPYGEATITLEDVFLQLGLPIEGAALTGPTILNWEQACVDYLGQRPLEGCWKGNSVSITWLENTYGDIPENATEIELVQYARAHILRMIGEFLMPDTSASTVHLMYLYPLIDFSKPYSWGAAVLACLYRGLDRAIKVNQHQIGGCLLLLQSWAWDHIPVIAPHIEYITDVEVLQGAGFPLARRYNILT
jgi:hypothetical protein